MKHTEIEFKWDANSQRAFARMKQAVLKIPLIAQNPQTWHISDVYVDSPTRKFEKEKIAFRVRNINEKWEATFKTRTEIINGKAVRREETCPLSTVKNLTQALQVLTRKQNWRGLPVFNLVPLFTLKNNRQTQLLTYGKIVAELAFDTCEILVCGRRVFFKEIELELKKGPTKEFEELATYLTQYSGLERAKISKVKTALSLLELWGEK